ncbi:MAG: DUF882 domain-containing protein [Polyangiales bacterium]
MLSSRSLVVSLLTGGASVLLGASSASAAPTSAPIVPTTKVDKASSTTKVEAKVSDDKKLDHHHAKAEKKHPRTAHLNHAKAHKVTGKAEEKKADEKKADEKKADEKKADEKVAPKADKKGEALPALPQPPPELTGSLPQAKLADKKAKLHDEKEERAPKDGKAHAHDGVIKSEPKSEPKSPAKASDKLGHAGKIGSKTEIVASGAAAGDVVTSPGAAPTHKKSTSKLKPCLHPAVSFTRLGQPSDVSFPLTTCAGAPAPGAVEHLSVLARPYERLPERSAMTRAMAREDASERPTHAFHIEHRGTEIDGKQVDAGLVSRLQSIADKFPQRTITVVSGIRPQSKGSPHASARAFDLRIDGVTNEALVAFCKTLPDTGCGYYPNSSFIHVDVRPAGTGHVYWIDTSGPGQAPHYVKQWPLPKEETTPIAHEASGAVKSESVATAATPMTIEETPTSAGTGKAPTDVAPTTDDATIGAQHDETHAGE